MWGTCGAAIALVFVLGLSGLERNGVTFAHPSASLAQLSYDELEEAAAAHGMELIHPSEWDQGDPSRRLAFEGSNCEDVEVANSPLNVCDGLYYGVERENTKTLRGPSLFVDTCFAPSDCGELQGMNRRMFMARAYKCEDGQTEDCPKESVWGVYSAITNSTGVNELGFLRAWANGALHPVDVTSQWWTFQYSSLDRAADGESRECEYSDCLIPFDGVTIECAPGSPNRTLPPGWTPYPSPAPTAYDTLSPIPTPSPRNEDGEAVNGEGDLNAGFPSDVVAAVVVWGAGVAVTAAIGFGGAVLRL